MNTDKSKLLQTLFETDDKDSKFIRQKLEPNQITERIISCAYKIGNTLGCGFLEKVYENALAYELRRLGLNVKQQEEIKVFYDGVEVGYYEADLLVENLILVELKAVREINDIYMAQCLNYLKATKLKICLLINFGNPRVEIKRIVL
jgi:GxxExxY protein